MLLERGVLQAARWLACYRPGRKIEASYGKYFDSPVRIESYWLMPRLRRGKRYAMLFPSAAREFLVRKLGGREFVCVERLTESERSHGNL